uniref:Venom serine protease 34 n=1 Tax=Cacopsylla melanoneura TaxID=428564 RepID=A0A8D8RCZ6_9HEMI
MINFPIRVQIALICAASFCTRLTYGFYVVPGSGTSYKDDVYSECDYFTELAPGNEYYIVNPTYPEYYVSDTRCRWVNQSPPNTSILLKCPIINLSQSTDCVADSVQVSLSGDLYMSDATKYCGKQSFTETSVGNKLVVTLEGLIMGKLLCTMEIKDSNKAVAPAASKSGNACECGKKFQMHNRIVNGHQTGVNEYPFVAALVIMPQNMVFCGASILGKRWLLTAAHCKESRVTSKNTIALVGDHDLTTEAESDVTQRLKIKDFYVHEEYNTRTAKNDMALVELDEDIVFSDKVMPICLPYHLIGHNLVGLNVTVLGWGTTSFGGPTSKVLMETTLQVKAISECREVFRDVWDKQLCTYGKNTDACQADSGGPLVYWDAAKKRWFLLGLISYGRGCAEDVPAVNTLVPCRTYLNWIEDKINTETGDSCAFNNKDS